MVAVAELTATMVLMMVAGLMVLAVGRGWRRSPPPTPTPPHPTPPHPTYERLGFEVTVRSALSDPLHRFSDGTGRVASQSRDGGVRASPQGGRVGAHEEHRLAAEPR